MSLWTMKEVNELKDDNGGGNKAAQDTPSDRHPGGKTKQTYPTEKYIELHSISYWKPIALSGAHSATRHPSEVAITNSYRFSGTNS